MSDPEAVEIVRSMFPDAEILPYTRWQRVVRRWNRILEYLGLHDFVATYIVEDVGGRRVVLKQYLCSICHRPGGPAEELH
jgi:hypothetical protein